MSREIDRGLTPKKFVKVVRDSGNVITHWPLAAYLIDESKFTGRIYEHPYLDIRGPDGSEGLVRGRIVTRENRTYMRINPKTRKPLGDEYVGSDFRISDDYLQFLFDEPEEAEAWNQFRNVDFALKVKLMRHENRMAHLRAAVITHVWGAEQQLYTPYISSGRYPTPFGGRDRGFVQGTVDEDSGPLVNLSTTLRLGRRTPIAYLEGYFDDKRLRDFDLWDVNHGLSAGTQLRARVIRSEKSPYLFFVDEGPVTILNNEPQPIYEETEKMTGGPAKIIQDKVLTMLRRAEPNSKDYTGNYKVQLSDETDHGSLSTKKTYTIKCNGIDLAEFIYNSNPKPNEPRNTYKLIGREDIDSSYSSGGTKLDRDLRTAEMNLTILAYDRGQTKIYATTHDHGLESIPVSRMTRRERARFEAVFGISLPESEIPYDPNDWLGF